jgi:ankyrin repeat protein
MDAMENGDVAEIELLLEGGGVNIDALVSLSEGNDDDRGARDIASTALIAATMHENEAVVRWLLQRGAGPDIRSAPLMVSRHSLWLQVLAT